MLTLAVLAVTLSAAPDEWPQFRGPTGDGIAAGPAPTAWSETENVRWKVAVHGKGWSSPIVGGGKVWVTTAADAGEDFSLVALDPGTGQTLHDVKLFTADRPPDIRQWNTYASPTPCLAGGRVFAHYGSFGTACVDAATAAVVWKRDDLPCDHFRGPASSPVVWEDKLYLLFDGHDQQYIACLDAATGKTLWRKDRILPYPSDGDYKKAFATPAILLVDGRPQVVAPAAMGTIAYHPDTGDELWRVITGGMNEACRPILAHGLIYLTTGHTAGLWAVKPGRTGDLTKDGVAWKFIKEAPTRPSPVVHGDHLYLVNDTGVALCLEAKTGQTVWRERLDGKFSASPVLAGGNLYYFGEGGKTFVVAASPEYTPIATNKLDAGGKASPAVAGGALYLRTFTHLYKIGG